MPGDVGPARDLIEYSSFGSPINLYAVANAPARKISILAGDGTITVRLSGSGQNARTLTMNSGDSEVGEFTSIDAVTGITKVRVAY